MSNLLPDFCFGLMPSTNEVILIKRGESGYYPYNDGQHKGKEEAKRLNEKIGVTPAQAEAMLSGSLFSWDIPAANPDTYDENGKVKNI